jgi:hypothetical protein
VDEHIEIVNYFLGDFARATRPQRVIHVGAHDGQEVDAYLACGFRKILLIEANPELAAGLRKRFRGRSEVGRWRRESPPSWHPCYDGIPDCHRINDLYPHSHVKARMRSFYFHRFYACGELFDPTSRTSSR